ncbi:hypothetical protein AB9J70_06345 [Elizabethkingia anophelis]|nr:hypothetical protein [Elizabethkingia anophelis]
MSKGGFVKLDRGIFKNFLWNEAREFSKAEAWIDLIQLARFEASTEVINGKVIELQRGEIPASRRYLELRWSWGSTKVSNFLKTLAQMKMINQRQTGGQTIISLVKYSIYNDTQTTDKPQSEPQTNQTQTSDKPQANQYKELKEVKESKEDNILLGKESKEGDELFPGEDNILEPDKNSDPDLSKKVAPKKVFRPPSVQEVQAYCNERSNGISGYEFVTFYQSKGWMIGKNKMKDWQAAVRTWEAKRNKDGNNQKTGSGSSNVRNGNDKVSGTTEILGGARYTEFT